MADSPADIRPILDPVPVDRAVKRQAWDGFHTAQTPEEFRAHFDTLPIPREIKHSLWNAKFGSGAVVPEVPGIPAAPLPEGLMTGRQAFEAGITPKTVRTSRGFERPAMAEDFEPNIATEFAASPVTGAQKAFSGAVRVGGELADAAKTPPQTRRQRQSLKGTPEGPNPVELAGGTAEILGGGMEAASPLIPVGIGGAITAGGIRAAARSILSLGVGIGTQELVDSTLQRLGLPKEYADVIGQVLGLTAGVATHHAGGKKKGAPADDSANQPGEPSGVEPGETPVETQSQPGPSEEAPGTGGVVQEQPAPEPAPQPATQQRQAPVEPAQPTQTVQRVSREDTQLKPEANRDLAPGSVRVNRKGGVEVLVDVPLDAISRPEPIEGRTNTLYPERVEEYRSGTREAAPIEVRINPDGGFTIHDGEHRFEAALQRGDKTMRVWASQAGADGYPAIPGAGEPTWAEAVADKGQPNGKTERVFTPNNTEAQTRFRVRDADELVTSFDKGYDQRLQNRNTERVATPAKISDIKTNLQPDRLGSNANAGDGAPIESGKHVVAGNHRTKALRELYNQGSPKAQAYKDWLVHNADQFGLDPAEIAKLKKPVLTRELAGDMTPEQLQQFAEDANMPTVGALSDAEMAAQLARKMTGQMMQTFDPSESGALNDDFIAAMMNEMPQGVRAQYMDRNGKLNQSGVRLLRNAVFAKAYPDTRAIERMAEDVDDQTRNISSGMLRAAAKFATVQDGIDSGNLHPLDIAKQVSQAAETINALRDKKASIADWLKQASAFDDDPDYQLMKQLVQVLDENRRSAKRIGDILTQYADGVELAGNPNQAGLFGEGIVPTKAEILEAANGIVAKQSQPEPALPVGQGAEAGSAAGPARTQRANPAERGVPNDVANERPKRGAANGAGKAKQGPLDRLDAAGEAAKARLRARGIGTSKLSANEFFDPETIKDMALAIAGDVARGALTLERFTADFIAEHGPKAAAFARRVWDQAHDMVQNITSPHFTESKENFLDSLNIPDDAKKLVESQIDTWAAEHPTRKVVSFDDIKAEAKAIDPELLKTLKPPAPGQTMHPAVYLAAKQLTRDLGMQIVAESRKLEDLNLSDEQRAIAERQLVDMRQQQQKVIDAILPARSQDGRNLAYHRIMAQQSFDPFYWLQQAKRSMALPANADLPEGVRQGIMDAVNRGTAAEDKAIQRIVKKRTGQQKFNKETGDFEPVDFLEGPNRPATTGSQADLPLPTTEHLPEGSLASTAGLEQEHAFPEEASAGFSKAKIERAKGRTLESLAEKMAGNQKERPTSKWTLTEAEREELNRDPEVLAARRALANKLAALDKDGWVDTILAFRRAGFLTGPRTLTRNYIGNTAFGPVIEEVNRLPAAIVDSALSVFTDNPRQVSLPFTEGYWGAAKVAATKGVRQTIEVVKNGATADELAALDIVREFNGPSKVLNAYINMVGRVQSAADKINRVFSYERALGEMKARAGVEEPTEAMRMQAMAAAEYSTFNNPNPVVRSLRAFQGSLQRSAPVAGKTINWGIDFAVPFKNTPANIAARLLDYAGGGVARAGYAAWKAKMDGSITPEQQKYIATNLARGAVTGPALIYLGWKMAQAGLMTGAANKEPGERGREEAAGRLPGAVLSPDGKWRQISNIAPAGNLLVIGATMYHQFTKGTESLAQGVGKAIAGGVQSLMELPMLTGLRDVNEALQDPQKKLERFAASSAGSFVPALIDTAGNATDPTRREVRGNDILDSMRRQVQSRIPGARESLPPRVDALGRTITQTPSSAVDPSIGVKAKELSDPIVKQLVDTQARIARATKLPKSDETVEETTQRARIVGKAVELALSEAIDSNAYRDAAADKKARREILMDAMKRAHSDVSRELRDSGYREMDHEKRTQYLTDWIRETGQQP